MSTLALIGLGSNLGDRQAYLDAAIESLRSTPGVEIRAVSRYHETVAVGGPAGQGRFLNAAAALETTRDPVSLLQELQAIESRAGRVRSVHWGERTLDLDLLLYGDLVSDAHATELVTPHPRMALRRFVLAPLAEIAPEAIDPLTGRSVSDLLANLDRRPSYVALALRELKPIPGLGDRIYHRVVDRLGAREVQEPLSDWTGFEAECRARVELLRADRWPSDPSWIVSPFWLDETYFLARSRSAAGREPPPDWHWFLQARTLALPPTFVAEITSETAESRWRAPEGPIGRDAPILRIRGSLDVDAMVDEIVAACASTRV
jgi:2-amino-4-hydroxy-6-hydroxymethyldihydropteridine diphosphokinase